MSSSLRRILASRANGTRSQGPSTPEGKRRSSQNAVRHGLLARWIVMERESLQSFDALLTQHLDSLQPADGVEFGMVEEMVASYWRMRRAWAIETGMLEDAANAQGESDPVGAIAAAFSSLAASPDRRKWLLRTGACAAPGPSKPACSRTPLTPKASLTPSAPSPPPSAALPLPQIGGNGCFVRAHAPRLGHRNPHARGRR